MGEGEDGGKCVGCLFLLLLFYFVVVALFLVISCTSLSDLFGKKKRGDL